MPNSKAKAASKRPKLLSHSRPPTSSSSSRHPAQSSKATRTTIRNYHTLQKRLSHAIATKNTTLAASLQSQLSAAGGLEAYQAASTLGQSAQRGGDTSKVLVEWLGPVLREIRPTPPTSGSAKGERVGKEVLRILEVGALSAANALNLPGKTVVRRIDLRSNAPEIEEQDFMTLPTDVPWEGSTSYDVVSLSLVVNFVGDAPGRGLMLQRTVEFLASSAPSEERKKLLPALFLVLPLPCVDNSRYLDEDRLQEIMNALGYEVRHAKRTNKLYYSLWQLLAERKNAAVNVGLSKKKELRSGKDRNNFCISIG